MPQFIAFYLMLTVFKLFIPLRAETQAEICGSSRSSGYQNRLREIQPGMDYATQQRIERSNGMLRGINAGNSQYAGNRCMDEWHLLHRIRPFRWGMF